MGTVIGILILIADIWAIVQTIQSPASGGEKAVWVLVIFLLPLLGLLIWFFLGPKPIKA